MADYSEFIGRPTGKGTITFERPPLTNFAKAVKDEIPIYADETAARAAGFEGIPAPPTFGFAAAFWGAYPEEQPADASGIFNPLGEIIGKLMQGGGLVLHGEQEFEYHQPVTAGMKLTHEGRVADVYEKESKGKTMTFVVIENEYRDESGDLALTARMNILHRS